MLGGYAGRILRVNLTTRETWTEPLDESLARRFWGGRGLGGYLLWQEVGPEVDPLGPDNKLFIMGGPVSGTLVPGSNRYCIVTKSPETGLYLDSYGGGSFGPEVRFAGYDLIAIEGKASSPVFLWIADDLVQVRDASHLWGLDTWETEERILADVGDSTAKVCVIGPAGEKLSNLAVVQNEFYHQAGRGGVGAVFGSKGLKGIAIKGTRGVRIAEPAKLVDYLQRVVEPKFHVSGGKLGAVAERMQYGTPLTLNVTNGVGILPTRNFSEGQYSQFEEIDSQAFRKKVVVSDKGCYACNLNCTKFSRNKKGKYQGEAIGGPEYETNALFGSNLDIPSMEYIVHANGLCDRLGLDTVGAGNVIGWVMDCYEKGILTEAEIGFPAPFGSEEAADRLIEMMASRQGLGDVITNGVKAASEAIGKGSEKFAMQVRGLEFPAYRPGASSPGFALAYLVADRGACHRRAWPAIAEQELPPFTHEGRAKLVKFLYDQRIPWHCGVVCDMAVLIPNLDHKDAAVLYSYVTGWDVTADECGLLADRVATLLQLYNLRAGMTRSKLKLPANVYLTEQSGRAAGRRLTEEMVETMLDEYYALRGWDPQGVPTGETLERLQLGDFANALADLGVLPAGGEVR